jgi:hypothetical protein
MTHAGRRVARWARPRTLLVLVATTTFLFVDSGSAHGLVSSAAPADAIGKSVASGSTDRVLPAERRPLQPIRDALGAIEVPTLLPPGAARASRQAPAARRRRSVARRVLGGAIGATAGFFAGGYLGAAIEGDRCHCDDPGLKGALIGAPIGAVTGGILGATFF